MKKIILAAVVLFTITLFTSCTGDTLQNEFATTANETATSRTSGNMTIRIIKLDRSAVDLTVDEVSFTPLVGTGFTVVTNPGTIGSQTFTALEATATEPDDEMKVTKNPGIGQTVYTDKNSIIIEEADGLKATVNPGNIVITNATQIIIEDVDGV